MICNKSFVFQIYPNKEQKILINKTFGCCRFVYNRLLAERIAYYNETGSYNLKRQISEYKHEFEFLREVDSLALANSYLHLKTAFKNYFEQEDVGFPKFKAKHFAKKSYTTNNQEKSNAIRLQDEKHIRLPKLGSVKIKLHRLIPTGYKIKSVTITCTSTKKYFISILTEYEYETPNITLDFNKSLGLDYSSPNFYVDNQNRSPEEHKHFFRELEDKLAKEQCKLSHMQLHSNNYEKQRLKINKIHEKIANRRKDFIEKESTSIANIYDIVCVEDLDLKEMSQRLTLGKSTMDNGFGMFRVRLNQKLSYQGKKFIKTDKFYPSSKTCRFCGCINSELQLEDREWDCPCCGKHLLRDENAAINIQHQGLLSVIS